MIELGFLTRLLRLLSFATRVVHVARALPGTATAVVLMRVAQGHTRHSPRPS